MIPLGVFFTYIMFRSNSRTGSVLVMVQCVMLTIIVALADHRWARKFLVGLSTAILVVCFLLGSSTEVSAIGATLGGWVEPYNHSLAELLKDPQGVNERDKSWLIRKVQVEKGMDLFKRYPITGVGWGHFRYVRANIDVSKYKYLTRGYDDYALTRSSHNSYIQVLAEMGLLGIAPFVLIQLLVLRRVFKTFVNAESVSASCVLGISLFGVSIYFWTVSAVTGAVWYFVLGLFAGTLKDLSKKA